MRARLGALVTLACQLPEARGPGRDQSKLRQGEEPIQSEQREQDCHLPHSAIHSNFLLTQV